MGAKVGGRRRSLLLAMAVVVGTAVVLLLVTHHYGGMRLSVPYLRGVKPSDYGGPEILRGWVRFDAGWYKSIAVRGYDYWGSRRQSAVAFFPLYPLALRGMHGAFGGDPAAWGFVVTILSGFAAIYLLTIWARRHFPEVSSLAIVVTVVSWPFAFYLFGAVYADALFLVLALGAFLLADARHVVWAGLLGALAAATRPVGAVVALGIFLVLRETYGASLRVLLRDVRSASPTTRRRARATLFAMVVPFAGAAAYPAYLWWRFGDALAFVRAEGAPGWEQRAGLHTWLKVEYFRRIATFPSGGVLFPLVLTLHLVLVVVLLVMLWRHRRALSTGYLVFSVGLLAVPLIGSKDFLALGRYGLAAFPAFVALAASVSKLGRSRQIVLCAGCWGLMVFLASAYARGSYVG
jgi:hypothetical protein